MTDDQVLAAEAAVAGIADTDPATDHPLLRELQRGRLSPGGDVLRSGPAEHSGAGPDRPAA
ncbi:hypothetical protein ABZ595_14570 [Streptomyces rubradiris]|uniref:hypothetical protein n=1 Tax=Streptomyces rubradiris TaxID=285531 RepID=UPI0033EE6F2A